MKVDRITFNPSVMGGRPCIREQRVTVGMIVGMLASGQTREQLIELYPYLDDEDISQALAYAATQADGPSVIQLRDQNISPHSAGDLVLNLLQSHSKHLEDGALLIMDSEKSRIRILPMNSSI